MEGIQKCLDELDLKSVFDDTRQVDIAMRVNHRFTMPIRHHCGKNAVWLSLLSRANCTEVRKLTKGAMLVSSNRALFCLVTSGSVAM
jgi:hypothetical protein